MMKRKLFNQSLRMALLSALCLISLSFVSCSGDDEDEDEDTEEDNFETTGTINGYEYVDLGLSVKWAICNVGADFPRDYGDYFAWGETEPRDNYLEANAYTCGVEMDDIAGNSKYDAAKANWGGSWRLPTSDEMQELVDSCTWEWMTMIDVNGYLVTGSNGNSIFLPAAGLLYTMALNGDGSDGCYWSSTPYGSSTYRAYSLMFDYVNCLVHSFERYYGGSVRPVTE